MPDTKVTIQANAERQSLDAFDLSLLETEINKIKTLAEVKPILIKATRLLKAVILELDRRAG